MNQQPLFDLSNYIVQRSTDVDDQHLDMLTVHLGEEGAQKVVASLGGLSFRIPSTESGHRFDELVNKLGQDLAQKMVSIFGGEDLYIPRNYYSTVAKRHKEIKRKYQDLINTQGKSSRLAVQILALENEISDRQIRRILA